VALTIVLALQAPYVPAPQRGLGAAPVAGEPLWSFVAESLIPLLNVLERLEREEVPAPLSLAVSPLLCEMLADREAPGAFGKYLQHQAGCARAHAARFASLDQDALRLNAAGWEAWYRNLERDFSEVYNSDVLGALRGLQDRGRVEMLAMPATGTPLALLAHDSSRHAQLALAVESFKRHFGRAPRGLWTSHGIEHGALPSDSPQQAAHPHEQREQSARAAEHLARLIASHGFEYVVEGAPTIVGAHAWRDGGTRYLLSALPWLADALGDAGDEESVARGEQAGGHSLVLLGPLLCLRPHPTLAEQAWHAAGYAGEERFLSAARRQHPGALRLWRNTADNAPLSLLEPHEAPGAPAICEAQAAHWLDRVHEAGANRVSDASEGSGAGSSLCVALEAALLGSRWFEGHGWLGRVLRRAQTDPRFDLRFASDSATLAALQIEPPSDNEAPTAVPTATAGGATLWRNPRNAAFWAEEAECEAALEGWARDCAGSPNPKLRAILDQSARTLLLIQSADWPLALAALPPRPEHAEDVHARVAAYIEDFRFLLAIAATVESGAFMSEGQRARLELLCERDDVFAEFSFALWSRG
jgi:1,4-alpha-glucan branching enzyme